MSNLPKQQTDFIGAGFNKVEHYSSAPPKIKWGKIYKEKMDDNEKIAYLEKLASTMNHAADLIQRERDELQEICQKKEEQLISMNEVVKQNNLMLQSEVTRMNEQRQEYAANVRTLNLRIKELENGSFH